MIGLWVGGWSGTSIRPGETADGQYPHCSTSQQTHAYDDLELPLQAAQSPLQPWEYLENIVAEFRLEGAELEEVSKLPSEEVEVLEQPFEEVLGEVLRWKECVVVMGIAGRGSE